MWKSIRQKGSKSHLWKGGKTSEAMILRTSLAYTEWRNSVFSRDGYKCKSCGAVGQLHAHHIKSFSKYPELRLLLENGITLCQKCHSIVDPYAKNLIGRKRGTLLMADIMTYLDGENIVYMEQNPFIYFVIKGIPYAIKIETATGKLSQDQIRMMHDMERNGWKTEICRSFEQFVKIINRG